MMQARPPPMKQNEMTVLLPSISVILKEIKYAGISMIPEMKSIRWGSPTKDPVLKEKP